MTTTLILLILLGILAVGFGSLFRSFKRLKKRRDFAVEFLEKYHDLIEAYDKRQPDNETYSWLTYHSVKMQRYLGSYGEVAYKPAFRSFMIQSYQVIINTLPQFRSGRVQEGDIALVDDVLVRFIGVMEDAIDRKRGSLINPLIWLREGVQWIMLLPLLFMKWFGVLSSSFVERVLNNLLFKIAAAVVSLVGLASSIVTIVLGWDQFARIVQNYLP